MLQGGKESLPNDESYDLVMGMLFEMRGVEAALKYIDMALQSGYKLSIKVFTECIACCVSQGQLDTLATLIERCRLDTYWLQNVVLSVEVAFCSMFDYLTLIYRVLSENRSE